MPMPELPKLSARRRLYIATGSPYRQALRDYFSGESTAEVWDVERTYRAGDLLLTVIATAPRMFITLEVAEVDAAEDPANIWIDWNTSIAFDNGILVDAVASRAELTIKSSGYYTGERARRILTALEDEYRLNTPWFTPGRWRELTE